MDQFIVQLPQNIVEGLVELAVELDVTNMEDLVHAILKEKLNDILGTEFDEESSSVSLTQEDGAEAIAAKLRKEAASEQMFSSLGPTVDQAPDQNLSEEMKASVIDTSSELAAPSELGSRLNKLEDMFGQIMGKLGDSPFPKR